MLTSTKKHVAAMQSDVVDDSESRQRKSLAAYNFQFIFCFFGPYFLVWCEVGCVWQLLTEGIKDNIYRPQGQKEQNPNFKHFLLFVPEVIKRCRKFFLECLRRRTTQFLALSYVSVFPLFWEKKDSLIYVAEHDWASGYVKYLLAGLRFQCFFPFFCFFLVNLLLLMFWDCSAMFLCM